MTGLAMMLTTVTVPSLAAELTSLGVRPGMALLVHSSLRSLGWVEGGARAVVDALLAAVGPTGTLMVPAHTAHLTDPEFWVNPPVPADLWSSMRLQLPPFLPEHTASWGMGAIAEAVRTRPGARRSGHPLHSFAALGAQAPALLEPHALDRGLGERSPLARLEALDGRVLLLGVDHSVDTLLHLAEYRARWPGFRLGRSRAPLLIDGEKRWLEFDELDHSTADFATLGLAWRRSGAAQAPGKVAAATAELIPARALLAFAVPWIAANR